MQVVFSHDSSIIKHIVRNSQQPPVMSEQNPSVKFVRLLLNFALSRRNSTFCYSLL